MDYRVAIVPVRLDGESYRRAHDACHVAAQLWNHAVAWVRAEWDDGRYPSKYDIQKELERIPNEFRPIHAHSAQAVAHDVDDAIRTSRSNRKHGLKTRAPWRHKQYRPLSFTANYGWRITPAVDRRGRAQPLRLALSLGQGRPRILVPVPEFTDTRTGETVPVERWGEILLCWDRENRDWSLRISYETEVQALSGDRVMAIDEGIINSFTAVVEVDGTLEVAVVNGRAGRSIKDRRNKQNAKLAARQSRCKPGSRKHKQLAQARKKINGRARRRLRNFNHHVTAVTAVFAAEHEVGRIVVGDVRGIEQSTVRRRRGNRRLRGQLSQWERGTQEKYLQEKTGIDVEHIDESFTSQTCPACLTRNRPTGRNYRCRSCGFSCHRDVVGAINIWRRATHGDSTPIDPNLIIRITYLRAVRHWTTIQSRTHAHVTRRRRARSTALEQGRPTSTLGVAELQPVAPATTAPALADLTVTAA